jgi:hypothetical protein
MDFMKWLGIAFPRWLENDLRTAPDILRKSIDLALQIFAEVRAFAKDKGHPSRGQRRERVDPRGRDRGVGRAVSSAVSEDVGRVA